MIKVGLLFTTLLFMISFNNTWSQYPVWKVSAADRSSYIAPDLINPEITGRSALAGTEEAGMLWKDPERMGVKRADLHTVSDPSREKHTGTEETDLWTDPARSGQELAGIQYVDPGGAGMERNGTAAVQDTVNNIIKGQSLYLANCASCHGRLGSDEPVVYTSLENTSANFSKEYLINIMEGGRGVMPPFRHLSEEDKEAIVEYLFRIDQRGRLIMPGSGGE